MFYRWHFYRSEKGGLWIGKTKRGKGNKIMAMADRAGLPFSVFEESATPHEVTLVEPTLERRFTKAKPEKYIGDKAYDSDPLDKRLKEQGIEMIAPNKANYIKPKSQDGRSLRQYKRRWKIERLFSWFGNFRHLTVRYEYHALNFLGFIKLACILILLKCYL